MISNCALIIPIGDGGGISIKLPKNLYNNCTGIQTLEVWLCSWPLSSVYQITYIVYGVTASMCLYHKCAIVCKGPSNQPHTGVTSPLQAHWMAKCIIVNQ